MYESIYGGVVSGASSDIGNRGATMVIMFYEALRGAIEPAVPATRRMDLDSVR